MITKEAIKYPYEVIYEDEYVLKVQWGQNVDYEPHKSSKKSIKDKLMSHKKGS